MSKAQLTAILTLVALSNYVLPLASLATSPDLVISEALANPANETTDEFIELYNQSPAPVDLAGWHFTDGDALDEIVAWNSAAHGDIPGATLNSTVVPSQSYAVILDPDYNSGGLPYHFPAGTVIVTVTNSSLGNGLTPSSDPVVLYRAGGTTTNEIVDTYGTPSLNNDPLLCDDDGLDDIPFDPGDGISVEKIDLGAGDLPENWAQNADHASTPGALNHPLVNQPPTIWDTEVNPADVPLDGQTATLIKVKVTDPDGKDDLSSASIDLSTLDGSATQALYDDGSHGDELDGDDWYSFSYLPPDDSRPGRYTLAVTATDSIGQSAAQSVNVTLNAVEYSDTIVISELLPNPAGPDTQNEFIELYNTGSAAVNLANWQLTDGPTTFKIPADTALPAKSYLAFFSAQTKISLNNSGDTVSLLTPRGDLVSKITYLSVPGEDISYMRDTDNQFDWTTTPTPNAANQLTAPEDDDDGDDTDPPDTPTPTPTPTPSATPATRSTTTETTNTFKSITITEARAAAKSTKVKVTGIVTAEPDMLSGKFFYIQDDQSGIQIYSGKSNFPELKLGQEIEVSGTVSEAQGEKKINTGDDAIKVLRNKDVPDPQEIATGKVEEEQEGMLVKINGALSRQSGKTFYLDDGSGEAKISILSTSPLNKPDMKKGDAVTIVGIIGQTTSGYRVMPRIAEDLITGQVAGAETASEVGTIHQLPDAGPNANFILIIAGVFMASGIALWLIWRPKSKPINSRLSA